MAEHKPPTPKVEEKPLDIVSDHLIAETELALNILRLQDRTKPLVFSPLSICVEFATLHNAAEGETREEIRRTLLDGSEDENFHTFLSSICFGLKGFNRDTGVDVQFAHRLFTKEGIQLNEQFLADDVYVLKAETVDFRQKQRAAELINDFVQNKTSGSVVDLVDEQSLNNGISSVLVNALHFKGSFRDPFNHEVFKRLFNSSPESSREVNYMSKQKPMSYKETDAFEVLQIPYYCRLINFTLHILLPKKRFGLEEALQGLDGARLQDLLKVGEGKQFVDAFVPEWTIKGEVDLKTTLSQLGMKEAFRATADFRNLAENFFVEKAIHSLEYAVDANGSRVTGGLIRVVGPLPPDVRVEFMADHPFLFVVTASAHPLLVGIYN